MIGTETHHVPENENGGKDTLHGGTLGYDAVRGTLLPFKLADQERSQRNWTVVQYNTSSITYSLLDPSGTQGFPGAVVCLYFCPELSLIKIA